MILLENSNSNPIFNFSIVIFSTHMLIIITKFHNADFYTRNFGAWIIILLTVFTFSIWKYYTVCEKNVCFMLYLWEWHSKYTLHYWHFPTLLKLFAYIKKDKFNLKMLIFWLICFPSRVNYKILKFYIF